MPRNSDRPSRHGEPHQELPPGFPAPCSTPSLRPQGTTLSVIELCAGGGGQALGLHRAGFEHLALVELDANACATLRYNGRQLGWADRVHQTDIREWRPLLGDRFPSLVSAGVPCPPFSVAGKQLGVDDERNLFPALLDVVRSVRPSAVQIENVRGLMTRRFDDVRTGVDRALMSLGYVPQWRLLYASDFGVPQLRPRAVLVALRGIAAERFRWPAPYQQRALTVGEILLPSMGERGWEKAQQWAESADRVAPTIVGGSAKHGGPDLGPSRARREWATLGVDARSVADAVPHPGFVGHPRLTIAQVALLQGFPPWWRFAGAKTAAYRQVGNAFPPPVAEAVARQIAEALTATPVGADKLRRCAGPTT